MRKYSVFIDWKNKCCQNAYTTQNHLQIQSNLYQNSNGYFCRCRKNNLKFIWAFKGTDIAKTFLRKKNKAGGFIHPEFKIILHSYSNPSNMVLT